jgi:N-acetylglutamate synthase-like GNAT family acetyltransferase/DNA-binding MarR family transcriptional regulator
MPVIDDLKELAIGARMKRLYDTFSKDVILIYHEEKLNFEPKYFTLYYIISRKGEMGITEIADELNLSHPGVIHLAKELEALGYIESAKSADDSRKRILKLSQEGARSLEKFERVWRKITQLNKSLFSNQQHNLLAAVMETEDQLRAKSYYQRFKEMFDPVNSDGVNIIDYEPSLANHFKSLNIEWINSHFTVEEHDLEQLNNADAHILNDGGKIIFASVDNEIVGTCALIKTGDAEYELAKMAVDPKYRGRKIGSVLMNAIIKQAQELGAKRLWLESNTKLAAALAVYAKFGFKEIPIDSSPYSRANIRMELLF